MNHRITIVTGLVAGIALLTACGDKSNEAGKDTSTTLLATSTTTSSTSTSVTPASTTTNPPTTIPPTTTAAPASPDCGPVQTVEPNQKIVAIRGVSCEKAKQVLQQWDAFQSSGGQQPADGWGCAMGRIGDGYNLVCATEFPEGKKAKDSAKNVFTVVNQ